jgi:hypothetical protein
MQGIYYNGASLSWANDYYWLYTNQDTLHNRIDIKKSGSQGLYRINYNISVHIKFKRRSSQKSPSDVCPGIAVNDLIDIVSKDCESVYFIIFGVGD